MSQSTEVYDEIEKVVAKLFVLRDSCTGILHTEKSQSNSIWFQGAEAMLKEAVDKLQKALKAIETGEAGGATGPGDVQEETSTDAGE